MGKRRGFGGMRRLPSGRWQAFYAGPDLKRHTAPTTFSAKIDAEGWLASERRLTEDSEAWRPPKTRVAAALAARERETARTAAR